MCVIGAMAGMSSMGGTASYGDMCVIGAMTGMSSMGGIASYGGMGGIRAMGGMGAPPGGIGAMGAMGAPPGGFMAATNGPMPPMPTKNGGSIPSPFHTTHSYTSKVASEDETNDGDAKDGDQDGED
jgi:hypothetical protein